MSAPRNFSWFVEGQLAGMGWPYEENLDFLESSGINCLVNLTMDKSMYEKKAATMGIRVYRIAIQDFCPPTPKQVEEFMTIAMEEANVSSVNWTVRYLFEVACM